LPPLNSSDALGHTRVLMQPKRADSHAPSPTKLPAEMDASACRTDSNTNSTSTLEYVPKHPTN